MFLSVDTLKRNSDFVREFSVLLPGISLLYSAYNLVAKEMLPRVSDHVFDFAVFYAWPAWVGLVTETFFQYLPATPSLTFTAV